MGHEIMALFLLFKESYTEKWDQVVLLNAAKRTVRMKVVLKLLS
jgi:hypothetical protein